MKTTNPLCTGKGNTRFDSDVGDADAEGGVLTDADEFVIVLMQQ